MINFTNVMTLRGDQVILLKKALKKARPGMIQEYIFIIDEDTKELVLCVNERYNNGELAKQHEIRDGKTLDK